MATGSSSRSLISAAFILFVFSCLKVASANRTTLYVDEVRGLSELPMSELIHIRSSLVDEEDIFEDDDDGEASSRTLSVSLPMALPLKRYAKKHNERPLRRYGEHYEEKGKGDTKISKIFQLAVTALSFLAFGGYLLTLIIMAIRRNSGGGNNGNVIVLSNLQGLQSYIRPKRSIFDPAENNFEIEKLYQGMIMLSRSYAMYETKK
ncbi:uncharacterized protein LOC143211058 isoform X2 [Lasioglossum baleicum]|uniref:uncharacterized protein LOC143211058 isoform X2 n=1 Tax=Lasioglossum baleicum TaxID=434251 RepID=UPI003FCEC7C9